MVLNNPLFVARNSRSASYQIGQSIKFDDNRGAYLNRTPSSAGNRQTWTYSAWFKRGRTGFRQQLLNTTSGAYIEFVADNTIRLEEYTGSVQWTLKTDAVYRDNSAWYHIVVAFDSTVSSPSSDRIKIWINGERVTVFSSSTYPALNHNSQMNTANEHRIGRYYTSSSDYLDGYLAEVNFIDGSALDHEDFGELDDSGVWRPIKYAGSYTGNSFYLKFVQGALGTDSSGLGNNWTTNELWEEIGTPDYAGNWIGSTSGSFYSGSWENVFNGDVTVGSNYVYAYNNTATLTFSTPLTGVIEVFGSDGGDGSGTSGSISLSDSSSWSISGVARANATWHSFGSKSNITTITVSSPGGNGAILGAIRVDGNLLANISAKANYVNMADTPTTNWCTLNPLNTGSAYTLVNGNLQFTSTTNWDGTTGTFVVSSGKWYYEFTRGSGGSGLLGWCEPQNYDITTEPGDPANSSVWRYRDDGTKRNGEASGQSYGASWTAVGDVIGCALDLDAGTIAFYKNGTSQGTAYSNLSGKTLVPVIGFYNCTDASSVNFGQRDFEYTPPSGFSALNTRTLPAPSIKDGSDYFQTVLYTGNNSSNKITVADNSGNTWGPDFVWIKPRNNADHHRLSDIVRGTLKSLATNLPNAESSITSYLGSFDSDGFTISSNSDGGWNNSSYNYVSWNWDAGGTGSSNNDGSITSTVSANPTAGFSIVTYTGNNSSSATVGHGLNATPAMIILKARAGTNASNNWYVWHQSLSANRNVNLNTTMYERGTDYFSSGIIAAPTNTTNFGFTAGSNLLNVNENNTTYVAYCFAEIESYSKFGSYTGNGDNTGAGPFVYCGFKPAFIVMKAFSASFTDNWRMYDDKRLGYNPDASVLYPNLINQESVSDHVDILSNGFKLRSNNNNGSGVTHIFFAFASNPFGGDGVSPATAR